MTFYKGDIVSVRGEAGVWVVDRASTTDRANVRLVRNGNVREANGKPVVLYAQIAKCELVYRASMGAKAVAR